MAKYPAKDVSSWIGNSVPVAMKHYATATDEALQAAAGMNGAHIGGHSSGNPDDVTSEHDLPAKSG